MSSSHADHRTLRRRRSSLNYSPDTVIGLNYEEQYTQKFNKLVDLVDSSNHTNHEKLVLLVNFSDPASFFEQFPCQNAGDDGRQVIPDSFFGLGKTLNGIGRLCSEWSLLGKKAQEEKWMEYRTLDARTRHDLLKLKCTVMQLQRNTIKRLFEEEHDKEDNNGLVQQNSTRRNQSSNPTRKRKKLKVRSLTAVAEIGHGTNSGPDTDSAFVGVMHNAAARLGEAEKIVETATAKKAAQKEARSKEENPASKDNFTQHNNASRAVMKMIEKGNKEHLGIKPNVCNGLMIYVQTTDWSKTKGAGSRKPTNGKVSCLKNDSNSYKRRITIFSPTKMFAKTAIEATRDALKGSDPDTEIILVHSKEERHNYEQKLEAQRKKPMQK